MNIVRMRISQLTWISTKGLTTLVRTYLEFTIENGKKKASQFGKGESIRRATV